MRLWNKYIFSYLVSWSGLKQSADENVMQYKLYKHIITQKHCESDVFFSICACVHLC